MNEVRDSIAEKLHPTRVEVSPKFTALLAYLLDKQWTNPRILELDVTVEGLMNIWTSDGQNALEGDVSDFEHNIRGVGETADLTAEEVDWLIAQIPARGASGPIRSDTALLTD